jgi:paraquat-inducible protein B
MNENEALPRGLRKEERGISLVWVAPIVAILITAGMIWKSYISAGARITIVIENGEGIKDGKTAIMYKGIKIGVVEDIRIMPDDVSKLELTALIDKEASDSITREGNLFWKVAPKVSITEVSGLDTIISGVYIAVMPAANSNEELMARPYQDHFTALNSPPVDIFDPGLSLIVNTADKGDVSIGAPVLYKKQAIGQVEDKKLSTDRQGVDLYLRIQSRYADLIHEKSVFSKMDALQVKANLSGLTLKMGSFASFLSGGISVSNTQESLASAKAKQKQLFSLYESLEESLLAEDEVHLSIKEGPYKLEADLSKVYYKGVEAGLVSALAYDPAKDETQIRLKLHKEFRALANEKAYFWLIEPKVGFDHVEGLDTIIRGNYINFTTSDTKAQPKKAFVLNDKKPQREGVRVLLRAQNLDNIQEEMGVFYHGLEIGLVSSYAINKDKQSFIIELVVEPQYKKLLNASSLFCHKSGFELKAGLDGVALKTGSLETIVRGGIAVETPNFQADSSLKKSYLLYGSDAELRKAEYLSKKGIYLSLIADKLGSLKEGSPLYYKQIKVGEVVSYQWDAPTKKVLIDIFIMDEYAKEIHDNTLFYNASGFNASFSLSGLEINTESLETIMSGGISFYTPVSLEAKTARNYERFPLYESKDAAMNQYKDVTLHAKDSYGLIAGNTVMYKSVTIGHIESVNLNKEGVALHLKINSRYADLIKEDTLFWSEVFEVSLQGVKNFSAALKGTYIVIEPGSSGEEGEYFHLMPKKPVAHFKENGLRVVVQAQRLGGIKENTPLYYRQLRIGSVSQYRLSDDATDVDIEVFVEPCYAHLIRANSYFYNASGISVDLSLSGAKIETESLESILTGGIGVVTPDDSAEQAKDSQLFVLHDKIDKKALEWAPKLHSSDPMCE